ncbi:MAG: hypothetical protein KKH40_04485, partial [Nanoarchaeota archaeon]|nr:hypothetical protein [Nanoarchaeota archaeon]
MGLFNFFKKKSEPQEITFKELETWIDSFLEKKDVSKRIEGFKQFSENKIKEARDAINELESATLLNEKIPERVKHILSGNRKNYIQKINFFLDDLEFPKKRTEIRTFSIELSKKIDKLSEETQKSFFVLKEFLETEAATVAKKIKEIESESIKLRRLVEQENLELIDDILKLKNDYTQAKNVKEILEKEK